ncbi:MAG: hypothetical protein ABH986_00220 [archaeon]
MFKEYFKEGLIVLVLALVLSFLIEFIPEPEITKETIYSPAIMLLGLIALILPAIAAIPGGYLIAKKTKEAKPTLGVPAVAVALAGFLLISFSIVQVSFASDAELQKELDEVKELDLGMFDDFTAQEFRDFTLASSAIGLIFIMIFNFALGLGGAFIGKYFAGKN